ncbi:fatty acid cis/trans isomerase [Desulfogranum japonicum]|uniref:fatty acid cis/trans isomerase n=1 Tax=Desulfogranum japonicum TaxID=231447 RepID=UPI0004186D8F|nr:fatty acid cis/trans isomerase [Desulfogranum japonicum]
MAKKIAPFLLLFSILLFSCARKEPPPIQVQIPHRTIDYLAEVKPILDKRCAVCHSCYNSPCQLKLSSYEGLDRGGSKKAVYNASRLATMDPTRLFIDAQTTEEWRTKGFHSVTENEADSGFNDSLMLELLAHKMDHPKSSGEYYSEADDLTCSATRIELGGYLEKHPNRGMPFGFPPLQQEEFNLIAGWLAQGAKGPTPDQQKALTTPKPADAQAIQIWETFLNQEDAKHAMTARYLYEHLFLAHITFNTGTNAYFELLRSRTPPGSPIDLIDTVRPYDDPETEKFYYRFRVIHSTIVHKTHMVFPLDTAQLSRIKELFIEPEWLEQPHQSGYDPVISANPFVSFEQIPPRSRYQFLLDNVNYIIMTFIRGPVCRGQVALNVIHDHFWVVFQDPDHDLSVRFPGFLKLQKDNLIMPIEKGSTFPVRDLIGNRYHKALQNYFHARQEFYAAHHFHGLDYDSIWKGNRSQDTPLLTVYRHFDSASVHKGPLGALPRTIWVMDFPLLERIYYALVAGFDVYGTVGHQLAVRLYMDGLRQEGETYFLDYMPQKMRKDMFSSWYIGVPEKDQLFYDPGIPDGISLAEDNPKQAFIEHLVNNHFLPAADIHFDPVNYLPAGKEYPPLPASYETLQDYLSAFRAVSQPGTKFFSLVHNHHSNLAYIRIRKNDGTSAVVSIIINRWHDNVAFLFREESTLHPEKDRADFIQGFHGSYPNYFMDIEQNELPEFFEFLTNLDQYEEEEARAIFNRWGVNRANPDFWKQYDWFQERFNTDEPVQAGLFDLNRYYFKAYE